MQKMINGCKCALVLSLLMVHQAAFAGHWLMGLEAGYGSRDTKVNSTLVVGGPNAAAVTGLPHGAPLASNIQTFNDTGSVYGVLMGYEAPLFNYWMLGLEGNIEWENKDRLHPAQFTDGTGLNLSITADTKYSRGTLYGGSVKLGLLSDHHFIPYLRAGINYRFDQLDYTTQVFAPGGVLFDLYSNKQKLWGWLVGVGLETEPFRDSVAWFLREAAVRLEYNYTKAERIKFQDHLLPINASHTARPTNHSLKIALVWKHDDKKV